MSKSLGYVVDPLKIMSESGADILRMWVASTDYFDDVRIGKEVLAGSSDAYRKLRNTFRYLLGALEGFSDAEKVKVEDMPELERYMLHRLAELDATLREVVENRASESWLEFSRYTRALNDFANIDLSAFFFDIRKDCLYCDVNPSSGKQTDKRKAYRTVLDVLFQALVRYAAPIIPFTAEVLPGPKVSNPYRKMDRVMRRSDRILRRMVTAQMIRQEEYEAAMAEVPNLAGLERKVEKTLAAPPPEEKSPADPERTGPWQEGNEPKR